MDGVLLRTQEEMITDWRRKTVVFSAWQDNVIIDLYVFTFIAYSWGDFVDFNPVNNRA